MALSNHERVGKGMELLKDGLGQFVERELRIRYREHAAETALSYLGDDRINAKKPVGQWDAAPLLKLMWDAWNEVFKYTLGQAERTLVSELREVRNKWAHQDAFSSDDAYRALDSTCRLLAAVSAPQSGEVEKMKNELLRLRFDEQVRGELRKGGTLIETGIAGNLKPWREVVSPHKDVASGRYQQAEFAADLWQVHIGEGVDEYRDPVEFFRRTCLTVSLKGLLVGAVRRLSGTGGDPVIQLQTNFGGGKTHSMLALYHLFSGAAVSDFPGIDEVMLTAQARSLPKVKRVVLVGNKISPGNPVKKDDGTMVRTLWGELAWQLGGRKAFDRISEDDRNSTSPGDALRELFNGYGPCLVLIDEWVAYARQLHDQGDLPAGDFETQFIFAQVLTESAKAASNCLLVVSLPASDTAVSPHAQANDVEVGGQRGREALDRLRNVIGRVESPWRPASAEESFEIVRRRLFEPITDPGQFKDRDIVARSFADFYRLNQQEFPPECHEVEYEKRIKAAYPIHPEVFDRLYDDWSTLVKFQRTRGVLRLMATVIHALWEKGDKGPLIMPANIAIDDGRVQFELTRYLSDNWVPVIEKDIDGPSSLPMRTDGDVPNLGKYSACRRVARTIFLGSAPMSSAAHRGLEDRRIKLGCVMPGEIPAVFVDALRRLAEKATYLYQDGAWYWFSTQPTVTKLAEDRAEQLLRNTEKVVAEFERRLRANLQQRAEFSRVHILPAGPQDIPEDYDARLVVLGTAQVYSKEEGSPAETTAQTILESRGTGPRLYRNTLVFLAPDRTRLQDLDQAVRQYLAWESILNEKDQLDLTGSQIAQATTQRDNATTTVDARIPETWQWLLVPAQPTPREPMKWEVLKLAGADPLATRATKKLRAAEFLVARYSPSALSMELDRVPLWRDDSVSIRQLVQDFASYTYLPRLLSPSVLLSAVRDGVGLLTWEQDAFAFADSWDDEAKRFRGLRAGVQMEALDAESDALIVKAHIAQAQMEKERKPMRLEVSPAGTGMRPGAVLVFTTKGYDSNGNPAQIPLVRWTATGGTIDASSGTFIAGAAEGPYTIQAECGGMIGGVSGIVSSASIPAPPVPPLPQEPTTTRPKRYHGTVALDPSRVGRDAGRIAEEVIAHLVALVGSDVRVTLEVEADVPSGVPEGVVRTVTENARTLRFDSQGFEKD
jgi:predicted AAA+ superfamily ATPase